MFFFVSVFPYSVISSTVPKILLMYFGHLNPIAQNHLYSRVLYSAANLKLLFSRPAAHSGPKNPHIYSSLTPFVYFFKEIFNFFKRKGWNLISTYRTLQDKRFHIEIRNLLRGEASYNRYSLELFKYSFLVKKCDSNKTHLKRGLSRETVRQTYTKLGI